MQLLVKFDSVSACLFTGQQSFFKKKDYILALMIKLLLNVQIADSKIDPFSHLRLQLFTTHP